MPCTVDIARLAGAVRQALKNYRNDTGTTGAETAASTPGDAISSMSFHLESLAEDANRLFGRE